MIPMLIRNIGLLEHSYVCSQLAAMQPWAGLENSYDRLLLALRDDKLRETWVSVSESGALMGVVMFRRTEGYLYAVQRGYGNALDEKFGGSVSPPPTAAYVNALGVFPNFQRRGIGKNLMRYAESMVAAECVYMLLSVCEVNTVAQDFYRLLGYRFIGSATMPEVTSGCTHLLAKSLPTYTERNREAV